jgi:hypothetical protein
MNVDYVALSSDVSLVKVPGIAGRRKHMKVAKAKVAKPKVAKVAKPKAVAELSENAAKMLAALRSIADAEGNIVVASIDCAGVSGRSIGALLSVLSRRSLYTPGKKGFGVVKMPS